MATSKLESEPIEDYLEEDRPIQGQKYVCLSFISPENVLDDKKTFNFFHYLRKQNPEYDKTYAEFKEDFKYFQEENQEKIQDQFNELVDYQTNVRGVKVRGVYDNAKAANIRAKVLQKTDHSFHVFVGQVGYWLPWDPTANEIEDQEYAEPELNRLVKEYKNNETKKDLFYEEQKREKQKAAMEENIRLKKQQQDFLVLEREKTTLAVERSAIKSRKQQIEEIGNGGLSGKPVKQRSTEVIRYLSTKSNGELKIIGVGGIATPEDAKEKLEAGASLVQVYSGMVYEGPYMVKRINQALLK